MKKTYTHDEIEGGYFTVFSCLIFLVMATLIFTCLGGVLLYQGKSKTNYVQVGALEHLAANYDRELLERYHLFFLDPRMDAHMEEKTKAYYETCFSRAAGKMVGTPLHFLRLEDLQIATFGTMQEQNYRYFTTQVKEYLKYEVTTDALLQTLQGNATDTKTQLDKVDGLKETLDEKDAAVQELPEENTESVPETSYSVEQAEAVTNAQKSNPVKTLASIMKGGLLSYVTEGKEISKNKISSSCLPSGTPKGEKMNLAGMSFSKLSDFRTLMESQEVGKETSTWSEKGMLAIYMEKCFPCYGKKEKFEDTVLNYEMEYILGGNTTDEENLEYVMQRLILLRFCFNAIYAYQDVELNEEALVLATAMSGFTGSAVIVEATKYTILSAVSLLEAIEDVKRLLAGEKIGILKNKGNFRWSVKGMRENGKEKEGLTYETYLMLLFLLSGKQEQNILRMQDLMQVNIQKKKPGFMVHNLRAGVALQTTVTQKVSFLPGTYEFQSKKTYQY